jgi:hypothetical protein
MLGKNMNLTIITKAPLLPSSVVERLTVAISIKIAPASMTIEFISYSDASAFPTAHQNAAATNPALFIHDDKLLIEINAAKFPFTDERRATAILAHEIGHAFRFHQKAAPDDEEIWADFYACEWGFAEDLIYDRSSSRSACYADILRSYKDYKDFHDRMKRYNLQKAAGIVK